MKRDEDVIDSSFRTKAHKCYLKNDELEKLGRSSSWYGLIWCVVYGSCSVSLSLVNKFLFSEYNFRLFFLLSTGQLVASVIFSLLGSKIFPTIVQIRPVKWKQLLKILPLSLVNSLNAGLGFAGLRLVNLPMFLVLRRVTTPIVLILEYAFMKKVSSSLVQKAIGIAVVGTLIAGSSDLTFDLFGYLFTLGNNLSTATYLILIKKLGTKTGPEGLSSFEVLFYNSAMSLPNLAILTYCTGEAGMFFVFQWTSESIVLFSLSCVMGFVMNLVVFMCTSVNSPLATSVTGNIKDCLATLFGYLFFHDVVLEMVNVVGILISLMGGMIYSYAKLKESGGLGGYSKKLNKDSEDEEVSVKYLENLQKDDERTLLLSVNSNEGTTDTEP